MKFLTYNPEQAYLLPPQRARGAGRKSYWFLPAPSRGAAGPGRVRARLRRRRPSRVPSGAAAEGVAVCLRAGDPVGAVWRRLRSSWPGPPPPSTSPAWGGRTGRWTRRANPAVAPAACWRRIENAKSIRRSSTTEVSRTKCMVFTQTRKPCPDAHNELYTNGENGLADENTRKTAEKLLARISHQ